MSFPPTDEQERILDLYRTGQNLVIVAGAGTGKTTTLRMLAEATPERDVQYCAFNAALVADARNSMPPNVRAQTAHALAMAAAGTPFRPRLNSSKRLLGFERARLLDVTALTISYCGAPKVLPAARLAGLVVNALRTFCKSGALSVSPGCFAYIPGIDVNNADGTRGWRNNIAVRRHLMPALERAWADVIDVNGSLPYHHDYYLKLAQLVGIRIPADVIVVDEAQDLSPVLLAIVAQQTHAQVVMVGDSAQSIYGFTGAVDALERAQEGNVLRASLTQSFRFGPAIAAVANGILALLDTPLRLRGLDTLASRLGDVAEPDALLTRTNAVSVSEFLSALTRGQRPHLVGEGKEVLSFAQGAQRLMAGNRSDHTDLACFRTWGEVLEYVEQDEQGGELRLLVDLVEEFTVEVIIDALQHMTPENQAGVVITTAHKSKGREWPTVRLADDFPAVDLAKPKPDELRLLYVAVTRAREVLDCGAVPGLADALGLPVAMVA